ncbi:hypothetical protein DY000_02055194 [Brassica cretica]|uniref:Uncharacterized protein n=1 Tax=Brassica cretica TaxID=69181 RepID=A0ABQ7AIL5_BRACR|nr:hypothetical protein DY000_02055194 [Brassica cretica]
MRPKNVDDEETPHIYSAVQSTASEDSYITLATMNPDQVHFDLNLVLRRTYFNRHMLLRSTTVCLGSFDVHASQLHQNLVRVRVEPTVIVDTRISPKFVGDGPKLTEADIAICSCKVLVNPLLNETTTATQTTLTKAQHRD